MKNKVHFVKGNVEIQPFTTKEPIQMIGYEAGICYGSDTSDAGKNYKRGLDCITSGHGRTTEYPDVYMTLDLYSIAVIREFYTHIGGAPSRLQASTRYIDYSKQFDVVCPPSIEKNEEAKTVFLNEMENILESMQKLKELGIPKEDYTKLLPLAAQTKIAVKMNLRTLTDMSRVRMCSRAYWEFRQLFNDILGALKNYSEEWRVIVEDLNVFAPKCEVSGYCNESRSCGRKPKREIP